MISVLDIVLTLLQSLLSAVNVAKWPADIVTAVQAIVAQVEQVRGQMVTYGQLESLRVTPIWPDGGTK